VTDKDVGLATGTDPAAPMAWYDTTNGEIGDICVDNTLASGGGDGKITASDGTVYTVQTEWSNKHTNCIVTGQ
jgi:hypothetical protein